MRAIDADVLKRHIDKLPALPDGNFAGNHSALKALINMQPTIEPSTNNSEIPNSSDTISRQKAIEAVKRLSLGETDAIRLAMRIGDYLARLPPAQPVIVPCDYAKACNEVAMNRITSAVVYMEVLEDFREYGYVLVDMREVTK